MGVRFYDSEDMFSDDDYSTSCCSCSCQIKSCHKTKETPAATSTATNKIPKNSGNDENYINSEIPTYQKSATYKDIVGNCKEVRIEENSTNLRIIGNNNRVRITLNMGELIVIGNNTRLKVKINHGHIKYTGNDGRICLGNESKQQLVDYIGCNGILKVVNSMKLNKEKCTDVSNDAKADNNKKSTAATGKKYINKQFIGNNTKTTGSSTASTNLNKNTKEKSHSYSGPSSVINDYRKWQQFNNLFNNLQQKSMPNLTTPNFYSQNCCNPMLPQNVIQNIGNIVIADSSNICITPYSRNITTQA